MKGLKWLGIVGGVILLLVLASLGFRAMQERSIAGKLAKLRQMGHPTTMAELNAWYVAVPAESNAAIGLLTAMEMFPSDAPDKLPIMGANAAKVGLAEPWSDEARSLAREYVSSNATAYTAVSRALKLPSSRYPATFAFTGPLNHLSPIKSAAQKLALAGQLAAEEGKPEEATAAIEDMLRVGRTLEPEPIFISALVRIACNGIAVASCERVINRQPLSDDQLGGIQAQITVTLSTNCMERAFAGETAFGLEWFVSSSRAQAAMGAGLATTPGESIKETLYAWSGLKGADHDCYLDAMIRLQMAAREELPQRLTTVSNIAHEVIGDTNGLPLLRAMSRSLVPSVARGFQRDASNIAALRCALAALVVERFRIAHDGKLPSTLAELVPQYLAAVPTDPFDGKPLRFRPLAKGFVVYSLGEDGDDDGGRPRKSGQKVAGDFDVTFRIER